ncbi:MAG: excinuclease ABC subunit UvrA [Planctomycetota bacterium]|nr:excinuclease ABC subunit UvrA [Planctomycetota bacterium]MDA1104974.1 excinuclease ABC subunit UvrA [Planctomycetota bacterium]
MARRAAKSSPQRPSSLGDGSHCIRVRGAREHNLKGIDVDIPRDKLVVLTGPSGSGKSSLAFDTIFAEGQRKYMESLSAYARQFLDQVQKPAVESVEGLPPTIAIGQRTGGHTPRSTVATTTEIYDYLRLLFARCGTPTCWHVDEAGATCGLPIVATAASVIVERLLERSSGKRLLLCAPVIRARKGFHRDALEAMRKAGFVRARVNGTMIDLRDALKEPGENPLKLGRYEKHTIEAVVDRLEVKPEDRQRLAESVETTLKAGLGALVALIEQPDGSREEARFSDRHSCAEHPECALEELEPRLFSFNSPQGACTTCSGLGTRDEFIVELILPDESAGVGDGAIEPWSRNGPRMNAWYGRQLRKFLQALDLPRSTPMASLSATARRVLLEGTTDDDTKALGLRFEGVLPNLRRRMLESESELVRERLRAYLRPVRCEACLGARLKPEALAVTVAGPGGSRSISDLTAMNVSQARAFARDMDLGENATTIAAPIRKEIEARLGFLESVGLDYLTLNRSSGTLSGGEAQRIRLATQVGSGLVGVAYVLDEPTIGLHQRDNDRLLTTLRHLTELGNTVLVVEHDEDVIRSADHIVDIGPGPGRHGGTIVAQGTLADILPHVGSSTADYLSGRKFIAVPMTRRPMDPIRRAVHIRGAAEHNLRSIDVDVPLGGFVCVTGVSGSGKSTLVNDILLRAVRRTVLGSKEIPGAHQDISGLTGIERVVEVDQSPIGRTPRSNPATYTGVFDEVRKVFARVPEARIRGYEPGRFSFNVKGGRCETCQGQGVRKIEMHFLPDVFVTCEACRGLRFNPQTLEVKYRGQSIADILQMTIEDATSFFEAHPKAHRLLKALNDVGLGYMQLGQPSTTMSGGEAQRVKLATELGAATHGHTLYVLDEPTTGLHFCDVDRLLTVFQRLADAGHTLVVIEHNLDVIKCADWIIDLGPEGGLRGGTVVGSGTPEDLARHPSSFTGQYLATRFGNQAGGASRAPLRAPKSACGARAAVGSSRR